MKEINIEKISTELETFEQDHLLKFWNDLDKKHKNEFYEELINIDYKNIGEIFKEAIHDINQSKKLLDPFLEPVYSSDLGSAKDGNPIIQNYQNIGLQSIKNGKVAIILMAGGVGTRLGVPYPKGMYDVDLLSKKSLYQIQAERILKLNKLAHNIEEKESSTITLPNYITWCIMTSDKTYEYTKNYFESHNFFGLDSECVLFFRQYSIPCLDMEGKIILEAPSKISLSPEGNGGIYNALLGTGTLNQLKSRGIEYLHIYGVDNILVKVADPIFIGFCIQKNSDCGVKVIEKTDPNEAVGVVCKVDGKYQVVEYSEISSETAHKTNSRGQLLFNCGNIANHFFTMEFLDKVCKEHEMLRYHVAKKKITYVNEQGKTVKPDKPNGIKMEKFIFDVFPLAKKMAVWLVERQEEFSPLKNSDVESDCNPRTCRKDLYALHKSYVERAGGFFISSYCSKQLTIDNGIGDTQAAKLNDASSIDSYTANGTDKGNQNGDYNHEATTDSQLSNSSSETGINGCFNKNNALRNALPELNACEISPLVSYAGEDLERYVKGKTFKFPFLLSHEVESLNAPSILNIV